jgi:hypothetical protein
MQERGKDIERQNEFKPELQSLVRYKNCKSGKCMLLETFGMQ